MKTNGQKVFKIEGSKKIGKLLCKLAIVLTLVFGMYTMYNSKYFVKLNNTFLYMIFILQNVTQE